MESQKNGEQMKNPKVSIITPCYNSEKTIRRTIESVLHQTYKNIEYIIIDGKSSDHTVDIIKEYADAMGGKIKYVSEKDKGIYNAINKGIRMSTGKLIGIINSDDFYELDTVQKAVENMDESPYQVIYGYCNAMKGECTQLVKDSHHNLRACMIPHETCIITRRTYCKYGLYVEYLKIASDYELMMRLYETKKVRFKQIPEVLINYAIGGISSRKDMFPVLEMENAFIHYRYHTISLRDFIELVLLNSFSRQYLKVKEMSDKHFALYTLMDKWYEAKRKGKKVSDVLVKRGYGSIAIYGMGTVGMRLFGELDGDGIAVKYGIDRNRDIQCGGLKIVSPDMELKDIDAVIVTAVYYHEEIKKNLSSKVDCPVLSLEEILEGV